MGKKCETFHTFTQTNPRKNQYGENSLENLETLYSVSGFSPKMLPGVSGIGFPSGLGGSCELARVIYSVLPMFQHNLKK